MDDDSGSSAFKQVCDLWLAKIKKAQEHKKRLFQDDADTAFRFFAGPHDFMYEKDAKEGMPQPAFKMTLNKVAEIVQLFGPALYHRNPARKVAPRRSFDLPMEVFADPNMAMTAMQGDQTRLAFDQVRASTIERMANWVPRVTDLRLEARRCVDEALIKGRGCLWTELYVPPLCPQRIIGSFFDSVDNLVIDPDMDSLEKCWWIARKVIEPVWAVEREYGLPPGSLKGGVSSVAQQVIEDIYDPDGHERRRGISSDLLVYWKVYSRMGLGTRLANPDSGLPAGVEVFGDHVFLVIAEGIPYPLNLPPKLQRTPGADGSDPEVTQKVQGSLRWPMPTYQFKSVWPVTCLDFHQVPKQAWPHSHLKPGLGELKFLNWAYSFLAGKIRNTSRDFVVVLQEAAEELKTTLLAGQDLTMIELQREYKSIGEVVQWLSGPGLNSSLWDVIEAVEKNFERRVGLNELMYGSSSRQMRSATEADAKMAGVNIRPDDMAECVEAFMTEVAAKEAAMSRYYLRRDDVVYVLGDLGAKFWDQFVATSDLCQASHEFEYTIEAGSTRKPNKQADVNNMKDAMQILMPILNGFAQATGQLDPVNALLRQWCMSMDLEPTQFMLHPPQPQPPAPPPPGVPPGGPPSSGGPPAPGPGGPTLPPPGGPPRA